MMDRPYRALSIALTLCLIVVGTDMMFARAFTALSTQPAASRFMPPSSLRTRQHVRTYFVQNRLGASLLRATQNSAAATNTTDLDAPAPARKIRKTQLRTDLKQYRLQQSAPLKKPAWTIFTNAALEEIYVKLPTTKEDLLDVKGIGPKKIDQYGDDILSIVRQYTDANGGIRKEAADSSLPIPIPTKIDPESLTSEQREASELLLSPDQPNGFITGSAGTGKSFLLKYLVQQLQRQHRVGVCAPTGVAAIHVGGSTLHSFFGIGLGTGSIANLVKKVAKNSEAMKRIDDTDVLIIDECSMLSSDLLETLDDVVRQVRRDGTMMDLPFGGMQVICFGDFFQLPPISRGPEKPFCFDSHVWEELGLRNNMVELKDVQRQSNIEFVNLLNKIRIGEIDYDDIQQLNDQCVISPEHPLPTDGIVPTRLYSLNKDVDGENEAKLAELEGEEVVCRASNTWREAMPTGTLASVKKKMAESLSKEVPDEIRLKVGAQVMLTRNKNLERNLVNGSRGVVIRFDKSKDGENMIPVVRFDCGVTASIAQVEAVRYNPEGGPGCLVRQQVPLKLAWALTVHKSQGTTLSRAMLDISSAFEYGQCYVALSRVQSLEGLWLVKPAKFQNVKVSPQVLDFYGKKRHKAVREAPQRPNVEQKTPSRSRPLQEGGYSQHHSQLNRPGSEVARDDMNDRVAAFSSKVPGDDVEYVKKQYVVHRHGDVPYGSREYLLLPPGVSLTDLKRAKQDTDVLKAASVRAHRNMIFGAQTSQPDYPLTSVCAPLVEAALKDATSQGDQPQAMAALHGLSDWVVKCLDNDDSDVLRNLRSTDPTTYEAVKAMATGIPREGHSVVGQGTYRDGEEGWRHLAGEFLSRDLAEEVELYKLLGGEVVKIEHLADRNPSYLESAGGAMARLFFL